MKIISVPQDIYQKHENEWLAIRQSGEGRTSKRKTDMPIWEIPHISRSQSETIDKQ
ncbi:hypothetical protein [Oryzifoliimicrobium ureilyticus]|uniref:hypothetical protein n=1 Tax=Oryzifoliimicrobium ureilyticus TaxID=3113724 RepID=UPI003075F4B7